MFITRIIAPALLAFGLLATATPTKRSNAQVETVFNTLKTKTDTILPQFGALAANNNASDATVGPLINQLTSALNTAKSSLAVIPPGKLARRQSEQDVANLVGGIVTTIVEALAPLQGAAAGIPELAPYLTEVDGALAGVLLSLNLAIAGILTPITAIVALVGGLLTSLGLGLVGTLFGIV